MGFSAKQVQALRRQPNRRHIRTREANGRELTYLEGWYAISEANRIFGFDGWSRETIESRCVLARENRGTFLAVYIARVRITVQADGATIVREGHGTGEGRGTSPGEVHDIALKAAETDATKRALATFGKPFGLELYRGGKTSVPAEAPARSSQAAPVARGCPRWLPPGRHDADPAPVALLRPAAEPTSPSTSAASGGKPNGAAPAAPPLAPAAPDLVSGADRQKPARHRRAEAAARQGASEVRGLAALPDLRAAAVRSASCALCPTASDRHEGQRRVHRAPLPRPSPATASGRQ